MNSLEYIDLLIKSRKEEVNRYTKVKNNLYFNESKAYYEKEMIGRINEQLQTLQQIKTELKLLNELKNLINSGDIFSPSEFYDEYESCLEGEGSATFITKDLEIIEDFEKGWKLIQKEIDKYGTFSPHKCKIAFVVWFNR